MPRRALLPSEHRPGRSCCHPLTGHFSGNRKPEQSRREVSAGHTARRQKFLLRKSPASCRAARSSFNASCGWRGGLSARDEGLNELRRRRSSLAAPIAGDRFFCLAGIPSQICISRCLFLSPLGRGARPVARPKDGGESKRKQLPLVIHIAAIPLDATGRPDSQAGSRIEDRLSTKPQMPAPPKSTTLERESLPLPGSPVE